MGQHYGIHSAVDLHADKVQDAPFFFELFACIDGVNTVLIRALDTGLAVFNGVDANADKGVREVFFQKSYGFFAYLDVGV